MTAATQLADNSALPDYQGKPVVRTSISIRSAGDGLSEGLAIDPKILPIGGKVFVVLECTVHAHDHDRIIDKGNDTGLLVLDQILKAGTGTIIDGPVVEQAIADQAEKIRLANEAAQGIQGLPFGDDLDADHDKGEHKSLIAGCTKCDTEKAATEDESNVKPISGRRAAKKGGD